MKYEILPINPAMMQLIEQQGADTELQPFSREILLLDIKLVDVAWSDSMEKTVAELTPGTQLTLVRTPDGDEMAISAYLGDTRIGLIPMEQNVVIARLMDAGKLLTCRVESASVEHDFMSRRPWVRVLVKIYLID